MRRIVADGREEGLLETRTTRTDRGVGQASVSEGASVDVERMQAYCAGPAGGVARQPVGPRAPRVSRSGRLPTARSSPSSAPAASASRPAPPVTWPTSGWPATPTTPRVMAYIGRVGLERPRLRRRDPGRRAARGRRGVLPAGGGPTAPQAPAGRLGRLSGRGAVGRSSLVIAGDPGERLRLRVRRDLRTRRTGGLGRPGRLRLRCRPRRVARRPGTVRSGRGRCHSAQP